MRTCGAFFVLYIIVFCFFFQSTSCSKFMYDVYNHCLNKSEVILSLLDIDVSLKMLNFIHIDVVIPSFISFLPHIS